MCLGAGWDAATEVPLVSECFLNESHTRPPGRIVIAFVSSRHRPTLQRVSGVIVLQCEAQKYVFNKSTHTLFLSVAWFNYFVYERKCSEWYFSKMKWIFSHREDSAALPRLSLAYMGFLPCVTHITDTLRGILFSLSFFLSCIIVKPFPFFFLPPPPPATIYPIGRQFKKDRADVNMSQNESGRFTCYNVYLALQTRMDEQRVVVKLVGSL